MRQVRVGDIEFTSLDDGTWSFPASSFFANAAEADWRSHVEIDAAGKIPVGHNYGLVHTGRELIVIDTGYGDETHGGKSGHLLEELARAGYRREAVSLVILTHAHGDHIKRNTLLEHGRRVPTFPNARYYLGQADWDWFSGPGRGPEFDEQLATIERAGLLDLVDGEVKLCPGVSLLPTPGHTPGHLSVMLESNGHNAIFIGDVCHHPLHFSHPHWVSTFDTHPDITVRTRASLFALAVEFDALLLCPHAPAPGFGRLRKSGGNYFWHASDSSHLRRSAR